MPKQREKNINVSLEILFEARWGHVLRTLECLFANKSVLMTMAVDTDLDVSEVITEDKDMPPDLAGAVKKLLLDDRFWQKVESLFEVLKTIVDR